MLTVGKSDRHNRNSRITPDGLFGAQKFAASRHEAVLAGQGVTTSKGMAGNTPRGLRR